MPNEHRVFGVFFGSTYDTRVTFSNLEKYTRYRVFYVTSSEDVGPLKKFGNVKYFDVSTKFS